MSKTLLLYLFVIFSTFFIRNSNLFAQTEEEQLVLDSLNLELNKGNIDDTTRIHLKTEIGQIGSIFRLGYWDSIQNECVQALQKKITQNEKNIISYYQAGALNNLGFIHKFYGDYKKALGYYANSIKVIKQIDIKNDTSLARIVLQDYTQTINNMAVVYTNQGNTSKGILFYEYAMSMRLKANDLEGAALTLNNLGYVSSIQGDIKKALGYYFKSLKIREDIKDYAGLAQVYGNIAGLYGEQNEQEESMVYYKKALEYWKKINSQSGVAQVFNNIGTYHLKKNNLDSAQYFYETALKIRDSLNYKEGVANSHYNLGHLFSQKTDYPLALIHYKKSLVIFEELDFKKNICRDLERIAEVYYKLNQFDSAKVYSSKALQLAKELGYPDELSSSYKMQYTLDKQEGNFKDALEMFEQHILMRDSVKNEQTQKETIKQQIQYDFEKQKTINDKEHEKQLAVSAEAKKKQKIIIYAVSLGFLLVLLFSLIIFNRLKVTRKQKMVIEEQKQEVELQKHIVEEKNKEITDSIQYAKRIQSAILPPSKLVKEYLKDSFILYTPKDIVAGDFYWMEHKNGKILFAAADCTGHGVPGAMVSVVCNNGLNRSVREHGLTNPSEILNKTREIVITEFEKSEDEVKDGMDIALCSLEGNHLQYAGANNPLWIIRNEEIIEIKANKQPIGKFDNPLPYTTHDIELEKGDTIYIFSDGYVDQFGGENGKKFKAANFKKLLLSIQHEPMERQRELIRNAFETWKGHLEQVDDVCVIGVRI